MGDAKAGYGLVVAGPFVQPLEVDSIVLDRGGKGGGGGGG